MLKGRERRERRVKRVGQVERARRMGQVEREEQEEQVEQVGWAECRVGMGAGTAMGLVVVVVGVERE